MNPMVSFSGGVPALSAHHAAAGGQVSRFAGNTPLKPKPKDTVLFARPQQPKLPRLAGLHWRLDAFYARKTLLNGDIQTYNTLKESLDKQGKTLSLRRINLAGKDLKGINLQQVNLDKATLTGANLTGANLKRASLKGANLKGSQLEEANFIEADLRETNLTRAQIRRANLFKANLQKANLQGAPLYLANLNQANLQGANLEDSYLLEANFAEANLREANLKGATIERANLFRANLQKAKLEASSLKSANLQQANLQEADLRNADCQHADLQGANLQQARLENAMCYNAIFQQADLRKANCRNTNFWLTNLREADLTGVNLGTTSFFMADLTGARLEQTYLDPDLPVGGLSTDQLKAEGFEVLDGNSPAFQALIQDLPPEALAHLNPGQQYVVAYRTQTSIYIPHGNKPFEGKTYQPGQWYEAPWFSRNTEAENNPGLYIHPTRVQATYLEAHHPRRHLPIVQVLVPLGDPQAGNVLKAGTQYRTPAFLVLRKVSDTETQ